MTAETAVPTTGVGVVHETALISSTETSALVIELGSDFADPTLAAFAPNLLAEITRTRQDLCAALGFILPNISIENVTDCAPTDYRIRVRGITVASATIFPTKIMAIDMGNIAAPIGGTVCVDPVFGYPAVWIDAAWAPQAQ